MLRPLGAMLSVCVGALQHVLDERAQLCTNGNFYLLARVVHNVLAQFNVGETGICCVRVYACCLSLGPPCYR